MIEGRDVLSDLLPDEYIGSQILSTLLARYNLVLTRSGEDEMSIAPSNVAMASYSPSNFLVPTMAVNNILLGMGLHLPINPRMESIPNLPISNPQSFSPNQPLSLLIHSRKCPSHSRIKASSSF